MFILHILILFQKHIPQSQTSSLKDAKKKSKFVPLFSQEGQEKAVIKLQGIKDIQTFNYISVLQRTLSLYCYYSLQSNLY